MKTLKLATSTFDQENTFTFAEFKYGNECSLRRGYQKVGDGIYWALQHSGCLKDVYSDADRAERDRLSSGEFTIKHGEIVLIGGEQYRTKFLGKYSDCAIFEKI